tara:strand:+ start:2223 stop:3038 length:816 start_codon:yes stop_codon:yes gene_type:complete
MPWKHNGRTIEIGKAWISDDNYKYPNQWNTLTDEQKKSAGLVWEDDPTPQPYFDSFYYYGWNSDGDALLPKPLADLKILKIDEAKKTSASLLQDTDWYVTRKSETDVAIPSGISAYRTAVRTVYTALKTAINNASDIDSLIACYGSIAGASITDKTIDATSSSVVSTSDNTITSNGHGFVNDEQVNYNAGLNSSDAEAAVIGGLVNNTTYYVISTATNTFKLSESHSNCGDAAVVSLTGLSSDGTKQTFTSQGKPNVGQTFPNFNMPKYSA